MGRMSQERREKETVFCESENSNDGDKMNHIVWRATCAPVGVMPIRNLKWGVRLLFFAISFCFPVEAQRVAGDWHGTLNAGPVELRLVLHVKTDGAGYTGSLDSIDQGANGIPISEIKLDGSKLSFDVNAVHGRYSGTIQGDTITGTWTQGQPGLVALFETTG
jgi:hypothetical protein